MTTIQNFSNINQSQFYLTATPKVKKAEENLPVNKENMDQTNQNDDGFFSAKTVLASLAGLATIGAGIWYVKSGKGASKINASVSAQNSVSEGATTIPLIPKKDVITSRIAELRQTIQSEYAVKKQAIIDEMNIFDEFDDRVPFTNEKEIFEEVKTRLAAYNDKNSKVGNIIANARSTIKNKIAELKDNPEWIELRTLRKDMRKKLVKSESEDEIKILKDKITIINDLMINRVYPEEMERYVQFIGIEDKNAYKLLKKDFKTYDEFMKEYEAAKTVVSGEPLLEDAEIRFIDSNKLTLEKIFPYEMFAINTNNKAVVRLRKAYEAADRVYKKFIAKRKELSQEFKQSENIKELKKLVAELKSLADNPDVKEAA